jgi:hypothetical protein
VGNAKYWPDAYGVIRLNSLNRFEKCVFDRGLTLRIPRFRA